MKSTHRIPHTTASAFSLVEIAMALGLMAFCLIGITGMLTVGLQRDRDSTNQIHAVQALTAVAADFLSSPASTSQTTIYRIAIPSVGDPASEGSLYLNSQLVAVPQQAADYFIDYRISPAGSRAEAHRLALRILTGPRQKAEAGSFMESIASRPVN